MKEITEVLLEYVKQKQTNHAVFINGKWGTGKTYFWDHELKDVIKDQTDLEPLYVSLYGVKSLDDVSEKLFFASKKIDFIDEKSSNLLYKGINGLVNLFNKTPVKFQIKVPYDKLVNFNKYVICFDDLERANIDIREVLGYITNLTERKNVKVIIIGCEPEIERFFINSNLEAKMGVAVASLNEADKKDPDTVKKRMDDLFIDYNVFRKIKEKLIGKTIEYTPDYEIIIDSIITAFDGNYQRFLKQNKDHILSTFLKSEIKNLRILKYALNDYLKVYDTIQGLDLDINDSVELKILIFHMASSFEILSGQYTKEDILSYQSTQYVIMETKKDEERAIGTKEQIGGKSLVEFFVKYFPNTYNSYCFFPSIWKYIYTSIFDQEQFRKEVCDIFAKKTTRDPVDEFLDQFWTLTDEEFLKKADNILCDVESGNIALNKYPTIFWYFETFINNKAISLDQETLKIKIKTGMDIAVDKENNVVSFYDTFRFVENKQISPGYLEIKQYGIELNEKLKAKAIYAEIEQMKQALLTNGTAFIEMVSSETNSHRPIFKYLESKDLCDFIQRSTNEDIIHFRNFLEDRYGFSNISEYFLDDYDTLNGIEQWLENEIEVAVAYSLKNHTLKVLLTTIQSILGRLINKSDGQK